MFELLTNKTGFAVTVGCLVGSVSGVFGWMFADQLSGSHNFDLRKEKERLELQVEIQDLKSKIEGGSQ